MTRDELINKIGEIFCEQMRTYKPDYGQKDISDKLADFIEEDRRMICEPLVNAENEISKLCILDNERRRSAQEFNTIRRLAINEALEIVGINTKD